MLHDYETIIREQLIDIINSNIHNHATLFIVISCEFKDLIEKINHLIYATLINTKFTYYVDIKNENLFEYYGIKKIYDLAINEPDKYYLYIHGKGMCYNHNDLNPRTKPNILLTRGHVTPWKKVLDIFKADESINFVGMFPSNTCVWFNFWWASGKYLITCENPKMSLENRYYYEEWLSSGNRDKHKSYNLLESNYKTYTGQGACNIIINLTNDMQ